MDHFNEKQNEEYFNKGEQFDNFVAEQDEERAYGEELKVRQNEFLDVYGMYLNIHTTFSKNLLKRKAMELEVVDPTFEFDLD